jgi:hypothetical protein
MTFTTGQTIRIRRTLLDSSVNFEDSLARFERYGPSGMVYATREDGSDSGKGGGAGGAARPGHVQLPEPRAHQA